MIQIVTRNGKVYITRTAEQDIEVNIGTRLVIDRIAPIVCEVINLEPTTPTITVKVIESNPVYDFAEYFEKDETILLTNSGEIIDAKSLSNTDKHRRIINSVKIYRRVEGTSPAPTARNITISDKGIKPLQNGDASWQSDESVQQCYLCKKPFTTFTRKHHCRNCGKIICDACSSNKYNFGNVNVNERVCDLCYNCASNTPKNSDQCRTYLQTKRLKERKFKQHLYKEDNNFYVISPTGYGGYGKIGKLSDDVIPINMKTTLDITGMQRGNIIGEITSLTSDDTDDNIEIKLKVTRSILDDYPVGEEIILENIPDNSSQNINGIQMKKSSSDTGIPVSVFGETPLSGGYKRRQSKRKRSLRRRHTTKRSNIRRRSKKNNKRTRTRKYRKSLHHR